MKLLRSKQGIKNLLERLGAWVRGRKLFPKGSVVFRVIGLHGQTLPPYGTINADYFASTQNNPELCMHLPKGLCLSFEFANRSDYAFQLRAAIIAGYEEQHGTRRMIIGFPIANLEPHGESRITTIIERDCVLRRLFLRFPKYV